MNCQIHPDTHSLRVKFQKVCRQIEEWLQAGKTICFQKIASLVKRRDRYAKQLLLNASPAYKAGAILLLASSLTFTTQAQDCKQYASADSANPIHRAGLPLNLIQPVFVDIDGDGDLDCYETSRNQDDGGTVYVKVTFLRNTGTAKFPYYEQDTANTFPKTPGTVAPYNSTVTRLRFVDIDGDGDYDCFAGDYSGSFGAQPHIQYFKNIGTAKKPKFVSAASENPLSGIHGSYSLQFSFADFDGDGDYDLITTDLYRSRFYKNVGTATTPQFSLQQTSYAFFFPTFSVYDYNKDGRTDIFNAGSGSASYYRNIGTNGQFKFVEDKTLGPLTMPQHFVLFGLVDLNKDGVPEAFSDKGSYAVSTPVATITKQPFVPPCNDPGCDPDHLVTLLASPAGSSYTYQWYVNNKPIAGATGSSYETGQYGKYSVTVKNSCGTGLSLPFVLNADNYNDKIITSLNSIHGSAIPIHAYPNPFTDHFTLNLGTAYSPNMVIKITDMQGRIISTTKAGSNVMQLGSNLPAGVYIVQALQNNEVVLTQKIVKE